MSTEEALRDNQNQVFKRLRMMSSSVLILFVTVHRS
jgi:hypothetical protein